MYRFSLSWICRHLELQVDVGSSKIQMTGIEAFSTLEWVKNSNCEAIGTHIMPIKGVDQCELVLDVNTGLIQYAHGSMRSVKGRDDVRSPEKTSPDLESIPERRRF